MQLSMTVRTRAFLASANPTLWNNPANSTAKADSEVREAEAVEMPTWFATCDLDEVVGEPRVIVSQYCYENTCVQLTLSVYSAGKMMHHQHVGKGGMRVTFDCAVFRKVWENVKLRFIILNFILTFIFFFISFVFLCYLSVWQNQGFQMVPGGDIFLQKWLRPL
jgi:hypothetical protein